MADSAPRRPLTCFAFFAFGFAFGLAALGLAPPFALFLAGGLSSFDEASLTYGSESDIAVVLNEVGAVENKTRLNACSDYRRVWKVKVVLLRCNDDVVLQERPGYPLVMYEEDAKSYTIITI